VRLDSNGAWEKSSDLLKKGAPKRDRQAPKPLLCITPESIFVAEIVRWYRKNHRYEHLVMLDD
jgi:hypothetical protein